MLPQKIPFRSTHAFTEFFLKYIEKDPSLASFYSRFPDIASFQETIQTKAKVFSDQSRKTLVGVLEEQYKNIHKVPDAVQANIQKLLQKNTFTITTGHQLSIFTGPLYFIYKIVTVINACKILSEKYPKLNFVPVFWMASEDHDYEEIKSFRLYGKKYTWETQQQGAVGRFHTKDFESLLSQLSGDVSIFRDAYLRSKSLSDAVRTYVNTLFGNEGLVIIDADHSELKKSLQPVMWDDIFKNTPHKLVEASNSSLEKMGFEPQVHPREINFFYLDKDLRGRLEKTESGFKVVDTSLSFTDKEIEKMISEEPEKLSPNVILRPVYQEIILPNLAYVGGPAELIYWLQLKSTFDHFKIPFPVLLPRNFALVVDGPTERKLEKTGMELENFFEEKNFLFNHWVSKYSMHDLSLGKTLQILQGELKSIHERCSGIDATLLPMVQAEGKRIQNAIEKIEKKMLKAEKRLQSDRLRQIESVKDSLFPNGSLQERTDNFLNFYQLDPTFIDRLLARFDPFDFNLHVIQTNDKGATEENLS